jgi:PAS domain S-box-containing protein
MRWRFAAVGFWCGLGLLLVAGVFTVVTVDRVLHSYAWVMHTEEVTTKLDAMLQETLLCESARRAHALTHDAASLAGFESGARGARARFADLTRLTSDNAQQQRRLAEFRPLFEARIAQLETGIAAANAHPEDLETQRRITVEGEGATDELRRRVAVMDAEEQRLLLARKDEVERSGRRAAAGIGAALAVSVGLLAAAFVLLRREIAGRDAAQNELDRFFSLSLDLLAIFDSRAFVRLNPAWERALGFRPDELVGRAYLDFVHPDDADSTKSEASRLGQGEEVLHFLNRYRAKDGSWRWLEWKAAPDKESGLVYAAARDVTAERKARAELEAANRELEAFSYSVSHDLRAPLRGIDGFGQALVEEFGPSLDPRALGYVERMRAATKKMSALIDALLSLARVSRAELRRERVDLSEIAETALRELRRAEPHREVEAAIAPGLVVEGDSRLLRASLENLLANAWKFTSKTEGARIEVSAAGEGTDRVFQVADNGAGFEMAHAAKLFGAFQRLHGVKEFPGTGIGLATVQRIVHRHGGRIWAESSPGAGAKFSFTLPGAQPEPRGRNA